MKLTNFAVLEGNCNLDNGEILHAKADNTNKEGLTDERHSLIRSSVRFSNGNLKFKIRFASKDCFFYTILKDSNDNDILVGYNRYLKKFVIRYRNDNNNTKLLDSACNLDNYVENEWLQINIVISGSSLRFFVNEILICEANISIKESPVEFILGGQNEIVISDVDLTQQTRTVFVVMQFSKEYDDLYKEVIVPTVEKFNMHCVRADDINSSTPILADIVNELNSASYIIADITPDNPNVFYELGFAHAIKKPAIILAEKQRQKLPFDLSGFRTIFYDNSIAGKRKIETMLEKYIESILGK